MNIFASKSIAILGFILLFLPAQRLSAQSSRDDVRAVIDQLFDGMRAGDSSMVASTFHEGAQMGRALESEYRLGSNEGFIRSIAAPRDRVFDERIWDVRIHVDQRLASAWMEYVFYLGDELHHCGVNSMLFYRTDDGWKITNLVDTDRGLDCDIPAELQK